MPNRRWRSFGLPAPDALPTRCSKSGAAPCGTARPAWAALSESVWEGVDGTSAPRIVLDEHAALQKYHKRLRSDAYPNP